MLSVQRQSKKPVKELQDLVSLPESMYGIWGHFISLDSQRSSNGYGANPLSYLEIKAYFDLIGEYPDLHEVKLLTRLDQTLLGVYAKQAEKEMKETK